MVQMRKRYKLILNVEVTDPDKPFPACGDYTHLNRITGAAKAITTSLGWLEPDIKVTLDKVIDKGELIDGNTPQ